MERLGLIYYRWRSRDYKGALGIIISRPPLKRLEPAQTDVLKGGGKEVGGNRKEELEMSIIAAYLDYMRSR